MGTEDLKKFKKHPKSILKNPSDSNRKSAADGLKKSAKFDEINVLETLHMQSGYCVEQKASMTVDAWDEYESNIDINELNRRLQQAANTQTPSFGDDDLSDDEFPENDEEKIRRLEFQRRRKAHYREYDDVKIARKLIEAELNIMEYDDELNIIFEITESEPSTVELEEEYEKEIEVDIADSSTDSTTERDSSQSMASLEEERRAVSEVLSMTHPCYGKVNLENPQQPENQPNQQEYEDRS